MKEGDVVLTSLSQADQQMKVRPVIFLRAMPFYRDLLVCGISTQLHREVKGFDQLIAPSDPDFKSSGLLSRSLIRLGFLIVVPLKNIAGSIGSISIERHQSLLQTLSRFLSAAGR
jgi:mRNA interferase MazF